MDALNFNFWLEQAWRIKLARKLDLMEATLLPNMSEDEIKRRFKRTSNLLFEIDNADEIEKTEKFNELRTTYYKEEAKKRRLERKAKRKAKKK